MEEEKIAIATGIGFGIFSLLPIWRSGRNGGQNLWEFLHHHSVANESESLWLREEELEIIETLADADVNRDELEEIIERVRGE